MADQGRRWFSLAFDRQKILIRAFSSGIGKSHLLLPVTFMAAIGIGCVNLGLVYYLRSAYSASPGTIGLFTSFYFLSYFTGCLLNKPLGRMLLPRYSMILATSSMAILLTIMLLVPGLHLAFALICLYGFAVSLFFPPITGWVSSGVEGNDLSKAISRWNISLSAGGILSFYAAGFLTEIDIKYPIITAIVLYVICALVVSSASLFLPQFKTGQYQNAKPDKLGTGEDKSTFLRFPSWVLVFSVYVVVGVIVSIFPVYANEQIGISKSNVGILMLARALFTTIGFIILGRTSFWQFKPKLLVIFQLLPAVLLVILLTVNTFAGFFLIMAFLGIIISLSFSCSLFHGTSGSLERSRRTAINELVISSAIMLGSSAGGQLFQHFSMQIVFLFCLLISLAGGVVQLVLLKKYKNRIT